MSIEKQPFGKAKDGAAVELYTLTNENGVVARLITYGAALIGLEVPDRNGDRADVLLGFGNLKQYITENSYFGCTTGRYAHRIRKGRFTLDGKEYQLATNNAPNPLHGGDVGFDQRI